MVFFLSLSRSHWMLCWSTPRLRNVLTSGFPFSPISPFPVFIDFFVTPFYKGLNDFWYLGFQVFELLVVCFIKNFCVVPGRVTEFGY